MDISTLTPLINAFRAETQNNSITPDSLGQLLQKIVNVLEQAGDTNTVQEIVEWKNTIAAIGNVLTGITLGNDDRNNMYLKLGINNVLTGVGRSETFTLRQATTERAGAMRAQQVTDLNTVRNKINHLAQLELKAEASPSSVQILLKDWFDDLFDDASNVQAMLPVASNAQAGIITAETFQKINMKAKAFYHIECDARDDRLFINYPQNLVDAGYKPYLLRYSKKRARYRSTNDKSRRFYAPTTKGWHLFYNGNKVKVDRYGEVLIGHNIGTDQHPVWEHTSEIRWLFGDIRKIIDGPSGHRELVGYKVGFGSRTHLIKTNHRFRFGIVFAPPLPDNGSPTLDFSKVVTNIAEFYVNFNKIDDDIVEEGRFYELKYSI